MKKVFLRGALGAVTALLLSVELVSPALLSLSAQGETAEPPASKERVWEFDSEEDMKDFMSEFTYSKYQGAPAGLEGSGPRREDGGGRGCIGSMGDKKRCAVRKGYIHRSAQRGRQSEHRGADNPEPAIPEL